MATTRHSLASFLIAVTLGCACNLSAANGVDPVATKQELQRVQKRIDDLQRQIKRTQSKRTSTEQALQQAEQAISNTKRKLRDVGYSLQQSEGKLRELRKAQQELNNAKQAQRSALKSDINAAYRTGRQEYVKLLLNQEQPDKMARLMKYYDYFHQARLSRIQAFNQTLQDIQNNEDQINQEMAQLESLKTDLDAQQQRLNQAKNQRKAALATLDSNLKSGESRVSSLKLNQSELEDILHKVQETLSDLPQDMGKQPFAQRKGKLAWPSQGKMLKRFGNRRENGKLRWNGVLISTSEGTPVKSVHHGRVVYSDWMRGFGMLTILDHGDGYLSLYGHNETLLKSPGDWVNGGEIIAYSGKSGGQNQASLYFEIRKNGKPINPSSWCRG